MSISADILNRSFKSRIIDRLSFLLPDRISDFRELKISESSVSGNI